MDRDRVCLLSMLLVPFMGRSKENATEKVIDNTKKNRGMEENCMAN
jgi:hypothetical protein